jgi:hypothetical protein
MLSMKKLLIVSLVTMVACAPAILRAQSTKPQPAPAASSKKTLVKDGRSGQRQILFRHPNAAQRGLKPSDLVLVKTPSGEERYARKKSQLSQPKQAREK